MPYDQAQSPRLGQRTPVETTTVRMFSGNEVPEASWPGQIIYIIEDQKLQIYNGIAWIDVTSGVAGLLTFVGSVVPVSQHTGDIWFNTADANRMYVAHMAGADQIITGEWELVSSAPPPITALTHIYQQSTPPGALDVPPPKDYDYWYEIPGNHQYYYLSSAPGSHWISVIDGGIAVAQATATAAQTTATAAQSAATGAQTTANGKNAVTYSTSSPGTAANALDDVWYRYAGTEVIEQWKGLGGTAWAQVTIQGAVLTNLDAGHITTGFLDAAHITAHSLDVTKMNINVGGANLLDNSSYEATVLLDGGVNSLGWWGQYGFRPPVTYDGDCQSGVRSVFVHHATNGDTTAWLFPTQVVTIGQVLTVSIYVKIVAGFQDPLLWDFRPATASYIITGGSTQTSTAAVSTPVGNGWYRVSKTFTFTSAGNFRPFLATSGASQANNTELLVDDAQIELGDVLTAYAPRVDEILPGTITADMIKGQVLEGVTIRTGDVGQTRLEITDDQLQNSFMRMYTAGFTAYTSIQGNAALLEIDTGDLYGSSTINSTATVAAGSETGPGVDDSYITLTAATIGLNGDVHYTSRCPSVSRIRSTTLTTTSGTFTTVPFGITVTGDIEIVHSAGTFTVFRSGWYLVTVEVFWLLINTSNSRQLYIDVNNSDVKSTAISASNLNSNAPTQELTWQGFLNEGDTFSAVILQNSGSNSEGISSVSNIQAAYLGG